MGVVGRAAARQTVVVSGVGAGLGQRVTQAVVRVAWRASDIKDAAQCEAPAALTEERFGGIDAVVHVAAMDGYFGGLANAGFETWKTVLDANPLGTLRMTRACLRGLRGLRGRGGGSVVFIDTQSAVAAPSQVRQAAYASSKGAPAAAMHSLARELGPERIQVDTVLPGWMRGPPVQAFVGFTAHTEGVPEDEVLHRLADRMALPGLATDGDAAEAAVFLVSDRARAITGQSLLVIAGELMR
ncbi:SDR family oxidoreductase [Actinacidiphila glaucinigra]